ncbi:MAG: hypothetical protein U0Q22_09520 [Acidimicrobiales bacterium]
MSLVAHRGWNETISELEVALGSGDAERVAKVAVDVSLGRVPSHLEGRARSILERITGMESELEAQRDAIGAELHRIGNRPKRLVPPAPSQLDRSA